MDKFIITNSGGFQRLVICDYWDLYLEQDDVSVIKIVDDNILLQGYYSSKGDK